MNGNIFRLNQAAWAGKYSKGIFIKNRSITTDGQTATPADSTGVAGQGMLDPAQKEFVNHYTVVINSNSFGSFPSEDFIFDVAYGQRYNGADVPPPSTDYWLRAQFNWSNGSVGCLAFQDVFTPPTPPPPIRYYFPKAWSDYIATPPIYNVIFLKLDW